MNPRIVIQRDGKFQISYTVETEKEDQIECQHSAFRAVPEFADELEKRWHAYDELLDKMQKMLACDDAYDKDRDWSKIEEDRASTMGVVRLLLAKHGRC